MAIRRTKAQLESINQLARERQEERERQQMARDEMREKLHEAEKIAGQLSDFGPITEWLDSLVCADYIEDYGYTRELNEERDSLKEQLEAFPEEPPRIENAMDQLKYEFFIANFSKIPLDALEWVVKTVNDKKLPV